MNGAAAASARVALLALVAALLGCTAEPAEVRLRRTLDEMQAAVETHRVADFMDGVAEDFGGSGAADRAALHNLLRVQMLRSARIGITRGPTTVDLRGDRAQVDFEVVLTGGGQRWLPERARALAFSTGWREVDGEWQVFYAEWKPVF